MKNLVALGKKSERQKCLSFWNEAMGIYSLALELLERRGRNRARNKSMWDYTKKSDRIDDKSAISKKFFISKSKSEMELYIRL